MGKVMQLVPTEIDIDELYDGLSFPEGTGGRPYVVFNMVSTVDGKVTIHGRSQPVGSGVDHLLMRRIRAAVDMVLVGAGTLRVENIDFRLPADLQAARRSNGLSPTPIAAVLSPSADLPLDRTFFTSPDFPSVVLTTRQASRERIALLEARTRVVYVGEDSVDLSRLLAVLQAELGVKRLLVEGGPSLNGSMMKANYADELFCTLAAKVVGGAERTMVQTADALAEHGQTLRLVSAFSYADELFLRYRFL